MVKGIMRNIFQRAQAGFTLIELLVVIGILTILMAITLVAINPAQMFADANNTQRRAHVNAILNAVHANMIRNNGVLPGAGGITTTAKTITSTVGATNIDLCSALAPTYIADLPLDPETGTKTPATAICTAATAYNTGYTILRSATDNRITVSAPGAVGTTISVTR